MFAAVLAVIGLGVAGAQQIAFTWDDLPSHGPLPPGESREEVGHKLIEAMRAAHFPAIYGFVNANALEREPDSAAVLKEWTAAGFHLGNHAWSHMNLNQQPLADWEADVLKNEAALKQYAGSDDWHWLRYPYLAEGDTPEKRTAARKFLAEHGYKIAGVTMSFADYAYNEPYVRCMAKSDAAAVKELETAYLDAAAGEADRARAEAKALLGHDIPYVLLMHVGAFDARMLPRLIQLYQDRGFSFVTLQNAEKDPFYSSYLDPSLPAGPNSLEAALAAKGLQVPPSPKIAVDLNSICR